MGPNRRSVLYAGAALATATLLPQVACRATPSEDADGAVTPEMFGAKGDGITNDTEALAAMAAFVTGRGGGEIRFRKAVYLVGRQSPRPSPPPDLAYDPLPIMEFFDCTRPLRIIGNGATIRCAPGLRFGTFDPRTGRPDSRPMPFYDVTVTGTPYRWMIRVEGASDLIEIADLELDGNLRKHLVGGGFGDKGIQIPATGIGLFNNTGPEILRDIHTHHHALDGITIDGADRDRGFRSSLVRIRSEFNGRQGCSIVGGRGYDFRDCKFNHTGRAGISSAPGGGVDIEAEGGKKVRDLTFSNCEFAANAGVGLLADQGDSEGALFDKCTFVGAHAWAAWPLKPRFQFRDSLFVGPVVNCFGDARQPDRATQFHRCVFRDDPALSPTRQVYLGQNPDGPIVDLGNGQVNVLFDRCTFSLTHAHALPWVTNGTIFSDCVMSQKSSRQAYPRGTYRGRTVIDAPASLYTAIVEGQVVLNGRTFGRGRL